MQTGTGLPFEPNELWIVDNMLAAGNADGYFYQDTWFARKLFQERPAHHVDVGSQLISLGVLSQFIPITYVDVRDLKVNLPNFRFLRGTLESLPFPSASVESISSLNVVEHCGLGRYGDPLDPEGTDKACAEIVRVTKPGGSIYVAVPTQKQSAIRFNANRIFAPDDFLTKFANATLSEECYTSPYGMIDRKEYEKLGMPHAYGCYRLLKES